MASTSRASSAWKRLQEALNGCSTGYRTEECARRVESANIISHVMQDSANQVSGIVSGKGTVMIMLSVETFSNIKAEADWRNP